MGDLLAQASSDAARASSAVDWRAWDLATWNRRLVEHFFLRHTGSEGPVVSLLVTPEELTRAVGAPVNLAQEVRDCFVWRVRLNIRRKRDLIEDATDYQWWRKPPPDSEIPRFVAHLIFTCLAAAESNEEFANEHSFIIRLRELTDDQLPDASLAELPQLWRNFAEWLITDSNRRRYRPLALPDPGGFTRIGHTVKLTFPDRRDQAELSRLLDERGLSGDEPPVASVLRLVGEERARFRRSFVEAYQSFRHAFEEAPRSPSLRGHRFWSAVREAALRGRGATAEEELEARVQLLAEPQDERLVLFIVADRAIKSHLLLRTVDMQGVRYNQWTHAVVLANTVSPDAEQLEEAANALLGGSFRLPRLSAIIDQGLLALVEASHGMLEVASGEDLEASETAFVRNGLATDLVKLLHAESAQLRPSMYPAWTQVHHIALRRRPSDILERTSLARCWQLHEVPVAVRVRLVGGVAAEDGWLGYLEVHPRVAADGGQSACLESEDGSALPLTADGNGVWKLPGRDLIGGFDVIVDTGAGESRRTVHFYAKAAADQYLRPSDPRARMVEGFDDSASMDTDPWLSDRAPDLDVEPLCERVTYLGAVVGEFVDDPADAAWRIVRFGGALLGAPVRRELCVPPTSQVADPGQRQRWRKMLGPKTKPAVPEFEAARRLVGKKLSQFPVVERRVAPSMPDASQPSPPDARVERLASILAARASSRAGVRWNEWRDLVTGVLGVTPDKAGPVMRAWEEAGCVDVASFARWRNLAVFARFPMLVAVRSGGSIRAMLMGLAQQTTRAEVTRAADRAGVLVEDRRSVSSSVPQTVMLRAPDTEVLQAIGRAAGIEVKWLEQGFLRPATLPRGFRQPPPVGYEQEGSWSSWSLERNGGRPGPIVVKWSRPDRPSYWRVTSGAFDVWTYHPNHARLWACAAAGEAPFESIGDRELRVRHAYLPLPLARLVSTLGAALPGPDAALGGVYRYVFVSDRLRALVLDALQSGFEPHVRERLPRG